MCFQSPAHGAALRDSAFVNGFGREHRDYAEEIYSNRKLLISVITCQSCRVSITLTYGHHWLAPIPPEGGRWMKCASGELNYIFQVTVSSNISGRFQ